MSCYNRVWALVFRLCWLTKASVNNSHYPPCYARRGNVSCLPQPLWANKAWILGLKPLNISLWKLFYFGKKNNLADHPSITIITLVKMYIIQRNHYLWNLRLYLNYVRNCIGWCSTVNISFTYALSVASGMLNKCYEIP